MKPVNHKPVTPDDVDFNKDMNRKIWEKKKNKQKDHDKHDRRYEDEGDYN